ncbi:K(+)/H(+) antiporter [Cardiobacterium hominis]|uniref:Transporter, CPA2 family n=1 Tax=Cardiobacterium hominis (strain ATCC 15826 / DSM 8339 / NCTC 10426 / 6573) TaxID=638300 RepID=C8N8V3_CARH6|nr:monovalent cation:proton antiporter-2 (CPA2) family protein [Cardiobacterium hominis]EEV88939.1 transporter, CPA2 family [Cardiobacterium hominis ATCC 15826]VEG76522.1 K(+)/H(+) antiporter [Cardiobacterium hominis]
MAAEGAGELVRVVSLLGAAVVAVPLFKRLGLGSVLGYLAAGLAIGPFGLKLVTDPHAIIHIAEFGVVMFLFVIGLEMKPSHLWGLRRQIFGLGSLQVVVCAILLTAVGMLYGFPWQVSFISAAGFVLTSTAIVMQVLNERGDIAAPRGQRIVSILLFEDLLIVPLLAIVAFLSPLEPVGEAVRPLWQSAAIAFGALAALVVAGLFVLNPLFRILAATRAREVMTAAALFVVLGAALLMEAGGLSMAMGAFVAGVLLSESSFRHQLEADIEPFRGLLLGLFFLGVGMSLDLAVVARNWWLVLSGVAALMATKAACIYAVARLAKSSHADALDRAVIMAQGGEFAFVLFSGALGKGVIDETVNANMTAIVVLSMVFTPLMIILHNRFAKAEEMETRAADTIEEQNPILIIGMGRFGQHIQRMIQMSGYGTTIIDLDPKVVQNFTQYGVKTHFGDASRHELLIVAGIEKACMAVVAIDNREQALQIVRFAREINPNIKIVARAFDRLHTFALYQAGADDIVREVFDASVRSGKGALKLLGIKSDIADKIAHYYFHTDRHEMVEQARVHDPALGPFQNQQMIEISQAYDIRMANDIAAILRGENVAPVGSDNDTDDA